MTDTTLPNITPEAIRAEFLDKLYRDWLGPAGGEEETLTEITVRDRYLVGMLAPRSRGGKDTATEAVEQAMLDPVDEQGEIATAGSDGEDGDAPPPVPDVGDTAAFIPSSLGLTVSLGADAREIVAEVRYGRYERRKDEEENRYWQRIPVRFISDPIVIKDSLIPAIYPEPERRGVYLIGLCRKVIEGYSLTLFLVNGQKEPPTNRDTAWIFQAEIHLYAPNGSTPFAKRSLNQLALDPEDRAMAMIYRAYQEFAVGHGVGVRVERDPDDPARARWIGTRLLPAHEVPILRARDIPGLVTDMGTLAEITQGGFSAALAPLTEAYQAWLEGLRAQTQEPNRLLDPYVADETAQGQIKSGEQTLYRIKAGIALLDRDPTAAEAFRFTNAAMRSQRVRTLFAAKARRGEKPDLNVLDVPAQRSWRPFQLAFILLNLPALIDPRHPDRSGGEGVEPLADLLWFPTGGGKTEAYLGLTAFALAIRRLQRDLGGFDRDGAGVTVIMRYTLRLLTLQQFQRASTLIAACEVLRRENPDLWGSEPFRIGLWVGKRSTPNYTSESAEAIRHAHDGWGGLKSGTPVQLTSCPWCGSHIDPGRNIKVETYEQGAGRTLQYCSDSLGECPFGERRAKGEGLPIVVVDEEVYRRLPALLIATVDKFAQMPWRGETQMLFGRVTGFCPRHGYRSPDLEDANSHPKKGVYPACRTEELPHGLRPPDLIIQDELHLISGPLGTLVGLYETAVEALCHWELDGAPIRPKVIASTATIRRAGQQVKGLFERQVSIFPPSGLDAADNFFAVRDSQASGRLYLGICAPGTRLKSVLIRAYVTVMASAQSLYEKYGAAADPYMTLIGYFNSVRELGGMVRVMDDAVQSRLRRMDKRGLAKRVIYTDNVEELTSRKSAVDIPRILDRLEVPFLGKEPAKKGAYPLDAVLATNMISVGVDVGRLGLMVVAGQPKASAEYIQATSRVGRSAPGVVITVYNWTRPRDLSHYERFEHYHATFYQQVEALSVTPFAPRALDRALSGVMVSLLRLQEQSLNKDESARNFRRDHPLVEPVIEAITGRAVRITGRQALGDEARRMLHIRLRDWERQIRIPGRLLTYKFPRGGVGLALLSAPEDQEGDWQLFTCLNSMREVEPSVRLILNDYRMDAEED